MIIAGNFYLIVFSLHLHSSVHFAVIRSNSHPIGWDQTLLLTRHTVPFFIYSNFTLLVLSPTIFSITYPLCRQGEQTVVVFVQLVPHPCHSLCAGRAFSSARSDLLRFQTWLKQCLGAVLVTFVPVYMRQFTHGAILAWAGFQLRHLFHIFSLPLDLSLGSILRILILSNTVGSLNDMQGNNILLYALC